MTATSAPQSVAGPEDDVDPFRPTFPGRRSTEASVLAQLFYTVLELALVLGLVVVAERCSDEAIVPGRPLLESADPDPAPRPTRAGVRSHKRPPVFGVLALHVGVVHEHLHIREGDHER